jgi:nucleoside 2-deoxyribosyltransferase
MNNCVLCKNPVNETVGVEAPYNCPCCGVVNITNTLKIIIHNDKQQKYDKDLLSSILCELNFVLKNTNYEKIDSYNIQNFLSSWHRPKTISEKLNKFLLYLKSQSGYIGDRVLIPDVRLKAIFYSPNEQEVGYLVGHLFKLNYIEKPSAKGLGKEYELQPFGWNKIYELEQNIVKSDQCFVALKFSDELKGIYEKAFKGIGDAGFKFSTPFIIEHNDKIDDLIISEIRRSLFVVADVTGHSENVYFEAGFAIGLGKTVIWCCRKDHKDEDMKFDTQQYSHILWENAEDLSKQLRDRIRATIPGAKPRQDGAE